MYQAELVSLLNDNASKEAWLQTTQYIIRKEGLVGTESNKNPAYIN